SVVVSDRHNRAVLRLDSTIELPWGPWVPGATSGAGDVDLLMGTGAGSFLAMQYGALVLMSASDLRVLDTLPSVRALACNRGTCLLNDYSTPYLTGRYGVDGGAFVLLDHPDVGTHGVLAAAASAIDGFDVLLNQGYALIARLPTSSAAAIVDSELLFPPPRHF